MTETEIKQQLQKCSCCKSTMLLETYFSKNRRGLYYKTCNTCRIRTTRNMKKHYEQNKEKIIERNTKWAKDNPEKRKDVANKYARANVVKKSEYMRTYKAADRHKCEHKTQRNRCRICDAGGHLRHIVGGHVFNALKSNKSKHTIEYLGCDIATFRTHIEATFKVGMTWENYGEWQIDHIVPIKYVEDGEIPTIEEVAERLHYKNTQALWAKENMAKSNRFIG